MLHFKNLFFFFHSNSCSLVLFQILISHFHQEIQEIYLCKKLNCALFSYEIVLFFPMANSSSEQKQKNVIISDTVLGTQKGKLFCPDCNTSLVYMSSLLVELSKMPTAEIRCGNQKKGEKQTKNPKHLQKNPTKPPPKKPNSQPKATSLYKTDKVPLGSSLESSTAKVTTTPLRPMSRGNKSCPARHNSCWSNQQRWGS